MPEGFDMIAKTLDNDESRVFLVDNNSDTIITYDFKKDATFPYATYMQREDTKTWGSLTDYREDTKDFDILWTLENNSKEGMINIAYEDISEFYNPFPNLDDVSNNNIKCIMISLSLFDAINDYILSQNTRGWGWLGWLVAAIVVIACIWVAPIVIPGLVVAGGIIGAIAGTATVVVVAIAGAVLTELPKVENSIVSKPGSSVYSGEKKVNIEYNGESIKETNEYDILKAPNEELVLNIEIPENIINSFDLKVVIENNSINNSTQQNLISGFLELEYLSPEGIHNPSAEGCPATLIVDKNLNFLTGGNLVPKQTYKLTIKNKSLYESYPDSIYILLDLKDSGTIINNHLTNQLKFYIHKP